MPHAGKIDAIGALAVVLAFLLGVYAFLPVTFYNEVFTEPVLMLRGLVLYRDLFQHHAPGIRYLLMPLFVGSGTTGFKCFACAVLVPALTAATLYVFASRYDRRTARLALAIYVALQPLFEGRIFWLEGCTGLLATFAAALAVRPGISASSLSAFGAGLLLGIGCTVKQTFAVFVFVFFWTSLRKRPAARWFWVGSVVFPLALLGVEWKLGAFSPFFDDAILYNLRFRNAGAGNYGAVGFVPILGVLAVVCLSLGGSRRREARENASSIDGSFLDRRTIGAWTAASLVPLFPRFAWEHWQQALPFVALLVARNFSKKPSPFAAAALAALAVVIVSRLVATAEMFRFRGAREAYDTRPELAALVRRIDDETSPGERLYVWGGDMLPAYALANRMPAARDFYPFPWMLDEERLASDLESTFRRQGKLKLYLTDDTWKAVPGFRSYIVANYALGSSATSVATHR